MYSNSTTYSNTYTSRRIGTELSIFIVNMCSNMNATRSTAIRTFRTVLCIVDLSCLVQFVSLIRIVLSHARRAQGRSLRHWNVDKISTSAMIKRIAMKQSFISNICIFLLRRSIPTFVRTQKKQTQCTAFISHLILVASTTGPRKSFQ